MPFVREFLVNNPRNQSAVRAGDNPPAFGEQLWHKALVCSEGLHQRADFPTHGIQIDRFLSRHVWYAETPADVDEFQLDAELLFEDDRDIKQHPHSFDYIFLVELVRADHRM